MTLVVVRGGFSQNPKPVNFEFPEKFEFTHQKSLYDSRIAKTLATNAFPVQILQNATLENMFFNKFDSKRHIFKKKTWFLILWS